MSDTELLRAFTRDHSQAAFTTIVERYLNVVYSAALRQVRLPQLAEEVSQSVFVDLSRCAGRLPTRQPLAAWLYVVTRRTAVDVIRRESRRQRRESVAVEIAAMKIPSDNWARIESSIDEAMEILNETERSAIVLRFFQDHSLREVGEALGVSEDAAQKRVSRALEQLRGFFMRRGLTMTAAGLATDLSAHALQVAPAGLAASISATAALTGATGSAAAVEISRVVAMTTLQKSAAVAAFALMGGVGLFQAAVYIGQGSDLSQLQAQSTALERDMRAARASNDALSRRLAEVDAQIDDRLSKARSNIPAADPKLEGTLAEWLARASRLKALLAAQPALGIPELRLLTDEHWAEIASRCEAAVDTGSGEAMKRALALARKTAEDLFAPQVQRALSSYLKSSGGMLPNSLYELLPYFESPIAPALLSRYHLLQSGKLDQLPVAEQGNLLLETREIVDPSRDFIISMGTMGWASHSAEAYPHARKALKASKP